MEGLSRRGVRTDGEVVRGCGAHVVVIRVQRQRFATQTAQSTPGVLAGELYRYQSSHINA